MENTPSLPRSDYGSTIAQNSDANTEGAQVNLDVDADPTTLTTHFTSLRSSSSSGYQRISAATITTTSSSASSTTNLFGGRSQQRLSQSSIVKMSSSSRFNKLTLSENASVTGGHGFAQRIQYLVNVLNHVFIGFVAIYMSWLCLSLSLYKTALHAWLVTLGFNFLMAEAIMCHYNGNVLTFTYKRNEKTTIHWMLQTLGGGLGVTGALVKCVQKGFLLYTTHGRLGFAAMLLCIFTMCSGLSALYAVRFKLILSPLLNKTFHNILGLATFTVAMLAQFYGYETKFFKQNAPFVSFQIMMKCLTLATLVACCIGPTKALYQKLHNLFRQFR